MRNLDGKTVVVTGGGGGIGGATCRRFAEAGARVAVFDMNLAAAQQVVDGICAAGGVAQAFKCNITDRGEVDAAVAAAEAALGPVDVLVNNAGWDVFKPFTKTVPAEWDKLIAINLTGALHMHHAVLPGMVERNRGHIINIGSTAGNWPYPGGNTYGGTKAFVQNFSRGLRADLLGKRIRVTCIEPGMSETNFSNVRFKGDDAKADKVYEGTKPLSAEDVADIIHWVNAMPAHVNINTLEVMPTCQSWSALAVNRTMESE